MPSDRQRKYRQDLCKLDCSHIDSEEASKRLKETTKYFNR